MKKLTGLIVSLLFLLGYAAIAQPNKISFAEFVKRTEANTNYRFYYNPQVLDTFKISPVAADVNMEETLSQLFRNTEYYFAVSPSGSIFITYQRPISTTLPVGFFDNLTPGGSQVPDITGYEKRNTNEQNQSVVYPIGRKQSSLSGNARITGSIKNKATGESLIGASIFVENPTIGVASDAFGQFSISLPRGRHTLKVKSIGMKDTQYQIMLYADGQFDIEVEEEVTSLKEVVVESDRDIRVSSLQMGVEKLDIKTIKQMPAILGEADVVKVMLALPGVQSMGEGSNGINVRGGATNQNLILFNDAVVYNPSHLFGFFSTFNPDIVKSVELYKSGINAEYGGRLSSVLDVKAKEGNYKKFSASGGISPVTGRLTVEGPIIKDKVSFLLSGRSTYSDWLLTQIDSKDFQNSSASFYDVNGIVSAKLNEKNSLYVSLYASHDKFNLSSDTLFAYGDQNISVKWAHNFSSKLYGVFTTSVSKYKYDISSDVNPVNAFTLGFGIQQANAKADFSYFLSPKNTVTAGVSTTHYKLWPGNLQADGDQSIVTPDEHAPEQGLETAAYAGYNFELLPKLSVYTGLRFSIYQYLGPNTVNTYVPNAPLEESNNTGSQSYSKGETITTYGGLEPRVSLRYSLAPDASVKLSYNRMRQYIHMLSNTTSIAPTDIWKLSDTYIKPQIGDQLSFGFYKNLNKGIETSFEAYYKTSLHTLDFKGGAVLLLNPAIETTVIDTRGKAYGVELMIKKATGKLNGWISYTYSRSFLQTQSSFTSEQVNEGEFFPSNYDKPHALNLIGNYKFSRRVNFSLNTTYSTGRPLTVPLAQYELNGALRLHYSDRNQFRIPDYFRVDVALNLEGNHKIKKLAHSSWSLSVYNLTGRNNVYSVYFVNEGGKIQGYQMSIFAYAIPTLTYNFKF